MRKIRLSSFLVPKITTNSSNSNITIGFYSACQHLFSKTLHLVGKYLYELLKARCCLYVTSPSLTYRVYILYCKLQTSVPHQTNDYSPLSPCRILGHLANFLIFLLVFFYLDISHYYTSNNYKQD